MDGNALVGVANQAATYCEARQASAIRLKAAEVLMSNLLERDSVRVEPGAHEQALTQVLRYGAFWEAEQLLGEIAHRRQDFAAAAAHYQRALDVVTDLQDQRPGLPEQSLPSEATLDAIARKAELARLAAPGFVPLTRDRNGGLAGAATMLSRSAVVTSFLQPVTFVFGRTDFSADGRRYAEELRDLIQQKQRDGDARSISLIGHTDAVGDEQSNLELSRRRARALADWLKAEGVSLPIDTSGRGESAPLDLGGDYPQELHDRMNRRVEVVFHGSD